MVQQTGKVEAAGSILTRVCSVELCWRNVKLCADKHNVYDQLLLWVARTALCVCIVLDAVRLLQCHLQGYGAGVLIGVLRHNNDCNVQCNTLSVLRQSLG